MQKYNFVFGSKKIIYVFIINLLIIFIMFRTARCVKILGKGVVKVVHRCDQAKENNTLGSLTHGHCTYARILSMNTDTVLTHGHCPYTWILSIHTDTVHT